MAGVTFAQLTVPALSGDTPAARQESGAADEKHKRAFQDFVQRFHKNYTIAERPFRFAAFCENYDLIEAHNSEQHGYILGLNDFSDITPQEFSKKYGRPASVASAEDHGGWPYPSLGMHEYKNLSIPQSKDWRNDGAVTSVQQQGECGACWTFAAVGALEGAWQIAAKQLLYLSQQQLLDCTPGTDGCGGGNPIPAFMYLKQVDTCTQGSYPYTARKGSCSTSGCRVAIPKGGIIGFKQVTSGDTQALLEAVAQQPVAVSINAGNSGSQFQSYRGGVFDEDCPGNIELINHAVLLIGYGRDGSKDYWLIKNSWGTSWGESGYGRLVRGKPGNGECGIKSESSYPVVDGSKVNPFLNGISPILLVACIVGGIVLIWSLYCLSKRCVRRCRSYRQQRSAPLVQPNSVHAISPSPPQALGGQPLPKDTTAAAGRAGNSRQSRLLQQPTADANTRTPATNPTIPV